MTVVIALAALLLWSGFAPSTAFAVPFPYPDEGEPIASVDAGYSHTVFLREDGTVWTWGSNTYGELGYDTGGMNQTEPRQVVGLPPIIQVAAGGSENYPGFTLALDEDGAVWAWGDNSQGQLGRPLTISRSFVPQMIDNTRSITQIAAGGAHGVALRVAADGGFYYDILLWGRNNEGQLGNTEHYGNAAYRTMELLRNDPTLEIAAGENHTLILKEIQEEGTLYAFGSNAQGQLGVDPEMVSERAEPEIVRSGISRIAAGGRFNAAFTTDNSLVTWGDNARNQLGRAVSVDAPAYEPHPVAFDGFTEVLLRDIALGDAHALLLMGDEIGSLLVWGDNSNGQIGSVEIGGSLSVPTLSEESGFTSIAAGGRHSAAIREPSSLWTWGANARGQLATGDLADRSSPHEPALSGIGITSFLVNSYETGVYSPMTLDLAILQELSVGQSVYLQFSTPFPGLEYMYNYDLALYDSESGVYMPISGVTTDYEPAAGTLTLTTPVAIPAESHFRLQLWNIINPAIGDHTVKVWSSTQPVPNTLSIPIRYQQVQLKPENSLVAISEPQYGSMELSFLTAKPVQSQDPLIVKLSTVFDFSYSGQISVNGEPADYDAEWTFSGYVVRVASPVAVPAGQPIRIYFENNVSNPQQPGAHWMEVSADGSYTHAMTYAYFGHSDLTQEAAAPVYPGDDTGLSIRYQAFTEMPNGGTFTLQLPNFTIHFDGENRTYGPGGAAPAVLIDGDEPDSVVVNGQNVVLTFGKAKSPGDMINIEFSSQALRAPLFFGVHYLTVQYHTDWEDQLSFFVHEPAIRNLTAYAVNPYQTANSEYGLTFSASRALSESDRLLIRFPDGFSVPDMLEEGQILVQGTTATYSVDGYLYIDVPQAIPSGEQIEVVIRKEAGIANSEISGPVHFETRLEGEPGAAFGWLLIFDDLLPPSGYMYVRNGYTVTQSGKVPLDITGTDIGSGVAEMRFSENGGETWGEWMPYQSQVDYTVTGDPGSKTIAVQFIDMAGNTSEPASVTVGYIPDYLNIGGLVVSNSENPLAYTPDFDPKVYEYTLSAPNTVSAVELEVGLLKHQMLTVNSPTGHIYIVEGNRVNWLLLDGENVMELEIYSQTTGDRQKYTLVIDREPSAPAGDLNLQELTVVNAANGVSLLSGFDPAQLTYLLSVDANVYEMIVTAVPNQSDAVVTIDGTPSVTRSVYMNEPLTTIQVTVGATNTTKPSSTYTVFVTRLPSGNLPPYLSYGLTNDAGLQVRLMFSEPIKIAAIDRSKIVIRVNGTEAALTAAVPDPFDPSGQSVIVTLQSAVRFNDRIDVRLLAEAVQDLDGLANEAMTAPLTVGNLVLPPVFRIIPEIDADQNGLSIDEIVRGWFRTDLLWDLNGDNVVNKQDIEEILNYLHVKYLTLETVN